METVCHPLDDQELLLISAALDAAGVPYFVVGQNFGSLYPGMQIASYNERTIRVPRPYLNDALQVIEDVRSDYKGPAEYLTTPSKVRMLLRLCCLAGLCREEEAKSPLTIHLKESAERRQPLS